MADMPRKHPPFLHPERNRHGVLCWYVRRGHGKRVRLRADYGTEAFWDEYRGALEGKTTDKPRVAVKSLEWALARYRESAEWAALANGTRRQRENIFRNIIAAVGHLPLEKIGPASVAASHEKRARTPHAANNFIKALRPFFRWAVKNNHTKADPTAGIEKLRGQNDEDGFHAWTEEEVARFEAKWPLGTRERLALDIMLYTGFRRGDVARFGRQHVRDGIIRLRTEKNNRLVTIPLLAPLEASIAATRTGDLTFIATTSGASFTKEGFGNWFGKVCRAAGVPGAAHGLRKISATRAAENGANEHTLMAMFGWNDPKQAHHYTRAADRQRLGLEGGAKMLPQKTR